jgi:hypothetical protein
MIFYTYTSQKMHVSHICCWFTLLFTFISCAGSKIVPEKETALSAKPAAPDYASLANWAAHPAKYDLSDSLPTPYRPLKTDTSVDVFFLYPTSYLDASKINESRLSEADERTRWNADAKDEALNAYTDRTSILNQASAFNACRVFAPRYRQAHIRTFYITDSIAKIFFDTAYADVKSAFQYYLKFENKGRPFIIASHSQGTLHASRLLKEFVDGKPLQNQLVAAYLIGLPVMENYFSQIPPCNYSGATGCFVSWRTFKKGYEPENVAKESFKAVVVNPLTWTLDDDWATRNANKGTVLYKFNKPKPYNVGAGIHGNILWSSKPRFLGNIFFTRKNYHIGDINLFWKNIHDNVAMQAAMFTFSQKNNPGNQAF